MKPVRMLLAALLLIAGKALAHGGLADLSIYDRTEGKRLQVHWHEGRAYVAGKPGNEYRIALRNRAREDLLAVVSVDGVNAVTGQTADPSQSGYVLSPHGRLDIQGWRRSLSQTAAFYFTSLPDSYAARSGRADNVGVIGVALFRKRHAPAEVITLYYDSRASLIAKGVIRDALPVAPYPRPFPGFVPDPAG